MGGRGANYIARAKRPTTTPQANINVIQQMQQNPPQQNQPTTQANPLAVDGAVSKLASMSDDALANAILQAYNTDMPYHINDGKYKSAEQAQAFVYANGVNELPTVLDDNAFDAYMKANGMTSRDLITRCVDAHTSNINGVSIKLSADQIAQMLKYSSLNYLGGKHGGHAYGYGTYFDHTSGGNTGYGSGATINAVLRPDAKVITYSSLQTQARSWASKNPKSARMIGAFSTDTASTYALCMGYQAISAGSNGYINVIDRSALVMKKSH